MPRAWAWALAALLAAGAWALHRAGMSMVPLLLVPVAFVWLVAWVFARSLRRDRVPLILRIVSGIDGVPPAQVPADVAARMFTYAVNSPETDRLYTRLWTEIKTGR